MARLADVEILLTLGLPPRWASERPSEQGAYGEGSAAEPKFASDWENYVRTVASRYRGKIVKFEIWNEVNDKGFYSGSLDKMVELTCIAYRVIKSVDSRNVVISPSMVGAGREPELFLEMMQRGVKACVDVVGYHFYVPKSEPEDVIALIGRVRASMRRSGIGDLPLWNTEYGWWIENLDGYPEEGVDQSWRRIRGEEVAGVVARSILLMRWQKIGRLYWYAWDNYGMGMIETPSGRPKLGAKAFTVVMNWLRSGDLISCSGKSNVWRCALEAPDGYGRIVLWSSSGRKSDHMLPFDEQVISVEGITRRQSSVEAINSVKMIGVGPEPILVTFFKRGR